MANYTRRYVCVTRNTCPYNFIHIPVRVWVNIVLYSSIELLSVSVNCLCPYPVLISYVYKLYSCTLNKFSTLPSVAFLEPDP